MNDKYDDEIEESAEEQAFQDEIDEALAIAFHEFADQAYAGEYITAYADVYENCIESGMDPDDARDIAKADAREVAQDEARLVACAWLQDASFDLVRDICDRHGVQMADD